MVLKSPTSMAMDIENTYSYMDNIYATEEMKILESLITIKNSVIGSNRQKQIAITRGIVPRLLHLAKNNEYSDNVRLESIIVLGSLAKGTEDHLTTLVEHGTINIIMNIIFERNKSLIDASLRCFRTLMVAGCVPLELLDSQSTIEHFLSLADPKKSINNQSCVITILSKLPRTLSFQTLFIETNASNFVAHLLLSRNVDILIACLIFFSNMTYENQDAVIHAMSASYDNSGLFDLITNLMRRDKQNELQLEAARCLTHFYRAAGIMESDSRIVYGALQTLVRFVLKEYDLKIRIEAANVLAYLTEIDTELQSIAAISNHLIASLSDLMNIDDFECKQAAFKVFASLAANDEDIRKKIIETERLMGNILLGLEHNDPSVRLASIRCLHSLSRSVQLLRTTFQDHLVWRPIMSLWRNNPPPSEELMTVASSTLCNLLLEFSPAKEQMLELGAVGLLCDLTHHPEPSLRLNAVWAIMNMAFCADQRLKSQILSILEPDQIFRLLADSDTRIVMKTLGLLRNLLSSRTHIDYIMSTNASQVMQAIILILEGPHSCEVKEQALCILSNIADGDSAKDFIMTNDDVLKKIISYMTHSNVKLQIAAVFCISNLALKGEPGVSERHHKLNEMGVVDILDQLISTNDSMLFDKYFFF